MRKWKRCVGIFLAFVLTVTGFHMGSFGMEAEAAPETYEDAYVGIMLTEEEFLKFSYTEAEISWDEYVEGENENGLRNIEARFGPVGKTIDEVLQQLKDRDKFFIQEDEEGYSEDAALGVDLSKANEGYYAVIAMSTGTTEQTVTKLDGVNGVLFDTFYYNELGEGAEPDEHTEWFPYTHKNMTVEVKAALTFRGSYSDITLKYGNGSKDNEGNVYPVTLRGDVAGIVRGAADAGAESRLYCYGPNVYGISGFDKTLFLPQHWKNEVTGEEGASRGMRFSSPTGEEEISFGDICAAKLDENGIPQEIGAEEETGGVDFEILYHKGYLPEFLGSAHLGIWKGVNDETGEEETGNQNINLSYYDEFDKYDEQKKETNNIPHIPEDGSQAVKFGSAEAWAGSYVWYNSPETDGTYADYRIDARGCIYDNKDRKFRVNRYAGRDDYDYNNEPEEMIGESATIEGALQALAYDSELNPDKSYYCLGLIMEWPENASNISWEIPIGNLSVPIKVKGLRLTAEGVDTETGYRKLTGILDTVNVNSGSELELTGWYRGTDGCIEMSGKGVVSLENARINGSIAAADMEISSGGETVVASLTGIKTLNLYGSLTVEHELGFADGGQLNVTAEFNDVRILARSGSRIEIPNVNCVYDTENRYGNQLEIFEEEKDGNRPVVVFSGNRDMGDSHWGYHCLNYQVDSEEADENGWKQEYSLVCPMYYYAPMDEDGNEKWEESVGDLIVLNDKVYRIEWDYDSGNGTDKITLDNTPCTLLYQKLVETEYSLNDIKNDAYDNDLRLIPYKASAVKEAGEDVSLNKNPYTDDNYNVDVWDEWNCEYDSKSEIAEYYVSGTAKLTGIAVEYGGWNKEDSSIYEGRSRFLSSVQEYLLEKEENDNTFTADDEYKEENGVKNYALYVYYSSDGGIKVEKSSHYVPDSVPKPKQDISLADTSLIQVITKAHTYSGSAISEKPEVKRLSDGYLLKEGADYTLTYGNNTNAGMASVTVTAVEGSGFTGKITASFPINPKPVSNLTVNDIPEQLYTGNKIEPNVTVSDGGKNLTSGDYTLSYSRNTDIGTAEVIITGKGNYTGTLPKNFAITVKKNASYTVGGYQYRITNALTNGKGTISVVKPEKNTIKKIKIADTVTIGGVKFQITAVEKNAFKNCKKATDVTIGKNVTVIGDKAFSGCAALKKVTIGKSVKTIGKSVFEKDGKLKTIKINSTGIKSVGKNALKGIHKKAAISVPKKQLKAYKKLLKGKGQASSVKIK